MVLYTGAADLQSDVQTNIVERKEEDHIHSSTAGAGSGDPSSILSESQCTHVHRLFNVTVVLLYTGIAHLFEVQLSVNKVVSWKNLGLALGLHYPTLQKIEREQLGRIDDCVRETLAAWLQQADDVCQYGAPSWSVLRTALERIGENVLAGQLGP